MFPQNALHGCSSTPSIARRKRQNQKEDEMTRILPRQIGLELPVAVGGKGIELFDSTGKAYIDASGGAAVSCLGHGHPDVNAALHAQVDQLAYTHSSFFTTEVAEAPRRHADRGRAEGAVARLFRQRRFGGRRSLAEDGAAAFRRDRPAAADEGDRAPAELSRQHAGSAGDRRQRAEADPVQAAADRNGACRSVLCLPLQGAGRERRGVCGAGRAIARGQDPGARP